MGRRGVTKTRSMRVNDDGARVKNERALNDGKVKLTQVEGRVPRDAQGTATEATSWDDFQGYPFFKRVCVALPGSACCPSAAQAQANAPAYPGPITADCDHPELRTLSRPGMAGRLSALPRLPLPL